MTHYNHQNHQNHHHQYVSIILKTLVENIFSPILQTEYINTTDKKGEFESYFGIPFIYGFISVVTTVSLLVLLSISMLLLSTILFHDSLCFFKNSSSSIKNSM